MDLNDLRETADSIWRDLEPADCSKPSAGILRSAKGPRPDRSPLGDGRKANRQACALWRIA